ncbi:hypothetical protein NI000_05120 [Paenibacillus tyrfis]|nr:hypothetical protein [Paenibacillus tyrfis]MCP1306613.1 hypothetical protein [Paenibacillus tyrfis]
MDVHELASVERGPLELTCRLTFRYRVVRDTSEERERSSEVVAGTRERLAAAVGVAALMSACKAVRGKASIREALGSEALRSKASGREEADVLMYRIYRFHFNIQVENVVCHTYLLPSNGECFSEVCCGSRRKRNEWMKLAAVAVGVAAHMSAGIAVGGIASIGITFGRIALRTIAF